VLESTDIMEQSQLIQLNNVEDVERMKAAEQSTNRDDVEVLFSQLKAPMNPHSLEGDYAKLDALTELSWVRCSHRILVLNMSDNRSLILEKVQGEGLHLISQNASHMIKH
jgi:hypothetical protein